jgi:hypothetical protein
VDKPQLTFDFLLISDKSTLLSLLSLYQLVGAINSFSSVILFLSTLGIFSSSVLSSPFFLSTLLGAFSSSSGVSLLFFSSSLGAICSSYYYSSMGLYIGSGGNNENCLISI